LVYIPGGERDDPELRAPQAMGERNYIRHKFFEGCDNGRHPTVWRNGGGTVGEEVTDGIANWDSTRALRDQLKEVSRVLGIDEAAKVESFIDMLNFSVDAAAPSEILIQLLPGLHNEVKDILNPLQLGDRALALLDPVD
jgi:hypothetical protein